MLGSKIFLCLLASIVAAEAVIPTTTVYTTNYYYKDTKNYNLEGESTTIITTIGDVEYVSALLPDTTTTLYYYDAAPGQLSLSLHYFDNSEFQTATLEVHMPPPTTSTITYKPCAAGTYTARNSKDEGILMIQKEQVEGSSFTFDLSTITGVSTVHHNIESDNINLNLIGTSFFSYIGYFAPADAGWYEFRIDTLYSLPIIQIGTSETGDWVMTADGTFSFFFYADGTNSEGLTALYPVVLGLEVLLDASLGIYKNEKLLNFDDIFLKDDVSPTSVLQYLSNFDSALSGMPTICENQPTTTITSHFTDVDTVAQTSTLSNLRFDSVTVLVELANTTTSALSNSTKSNPLDSDSSITTTSGSSLPILSGISSLSGTKDPISTTSDYFFESYTSTITETTLDSNGKPTQIAVVLIPETSDNLIVGNSTLAAPKLAGTISIDVLSYTTEMITVVSCSENKCSMVTKTTTYCPLTEGKISTNVNTGNSAAPKNTGSGNSGTENTISSSQDSSATSNSPYIALETSSSFGSENTPAIQQSENTGFKNVSFSVITGVICSIFILQFI